MGAGLNGRLGPGMFMFFALPNQGVTLERLEELILDEIAKLLRGDWRGGAAEGEEPVPCEPDPTVPDRVRADRRAAPFPPLSR